jgi:protein-S-isoprenylcysteine O-methyltransferase Ste14
MYVSLVCLYSGLAVFLGNWWTLILLPFLIIVVQLYVINKEEQYLQQAFGNSYTEYKRRVRRWI